MSMRWPAIPSYRPGKGDPETRLAHLEGYVTRLEGLMSELSRQLTVWSEGGIDVSNLNATVEAAIRRTFVQDSAEGNVNASVGLTLLMQLPTSIQSVDSATLRFDLLPFRYDYAVTAVTPSFTATATTEAEAHTHNYDKVTSQAITENKDITVTADYPTGITVTINGTDRTLALGGPWSTSEAVSIGQYLVEGWNTIVIGAADTGRVRATVSVQVTMEVV